MASAGTASPASSSLRAVWDDIQSLIKQHDAARAAEAEEAVESESVLQAKIDTLTRTHGSLTSERHNLISSFNARRGSAGVTPAQEDAFWTSLADIDALLTRTSDATDAAKLQLYFPAARGYNYRFAAPGVFLAVGDFWLSHLAGNVTLEAVPGRGQLWSMQGSSSAAGGSIIPPGIALRVAPVTLSLHIDELGLRGDNIPSMLRTVREIELNIQAEIYAPLAYFTPARKLKGEDAAPTAAAGSAAPASRSSFFSWSGKGSAAAGTGGLQKGVIAASTPATPAAAAAAPEHSINNLTRCVWRVLEKEFKFEVTKLEYKTKGATLTVPDSMLRWLINSLVPAQLKAAIVDAIPPELGMLLALHADHLVKLGGEFVVASLSLETLRAPLDSAVDLTPHHTAAGSAPPAPGAAASAASRGLKAALQESFRMVHTASKATPAATMPGVASARAAQALGLTAAQARAWVAAQTAACGSKTAAVLKTPLDMIRFVRQYNARSRARASARSTRSGAILPASVAADALHDSMPDGSGLAELQAAAEAGKADKSWVALLTLYQRLVDEHSQMQLMAVYDAASESVTKEAQRQLTLAAQTKAVASHFDVGALFLAAEALYNKPVHAHLSVHDLLLRLHAETVLGMAKAISLRTLRAKQEATTGSSGAAAAPRRQAEKPSEAHAVGGAAPRADTPAKDVVAGGEPAVSPADTDASSTGGRATPVLLAPSPATPTGSTPASTAGSSQHLQSQSAAAASAASLANQLEAVSKWSRDATDAMRILHGYVTRVTTSVGGWITGGERGRVSMAVRQLQLECAPGVSLPVTMTEGFFPPNATVTAMESRDEQSDALGWAAAGANASGRPPTRPHAAAGDTGRGTYSVMIAWPKVVPDGKDAPAASSSLHAIEEALERETSAASDAAPVDAPTLRSASPALPQYRARSASDMSTASALARRSGIAPAARAAAAVLTPDDVEVMATIRIHRLWLGLRVDEAALVHMVTARADAVTAGLVPGSRGFPPLHALEIGFRPAVYGSSYSATGLDPAAIAQAAATRADAAISAGGEIIRPPAWPYVLSIETPSWTRMCLEAVAIDASGDIPVLTRQLSAMLHSVWAAAAANEGTHHTDARSPSHGMSASSASMVDSPRTGGSFAAPRASMAGSFSGTGTIAAAADAAVDAMRSAGVVPTRSSRAASLVTDGPPPLPPSGRKSSLAGSTAAAVAAAAASEREHARSTSFASSGVDGGSAKQLRVAHAQAVMGEASATITSRVRRYLRNDALRASLNVFISLLSVPAPPLVGALEDDVIVATGSIAAAERALAQRMAPCIRDIAGIPDADATPAAAAGETMRKVLSLSISSKHAMQPSMIPPPASALHAMPAKATKGTPAAVPVAAVASVTDAGVSDGKGGVGTTSDPAVAAAAPVARAVASATPVLSAPAFVVDVQVAFLTLMDDIHVLQSVLHATDAVQAQLM